ncbi:hypothetical protein [Siminovitchia fordii]|uniref:hypothetical protein n=1 Tax=Siminovitchia fordii TaxID=254759 RepID=UPI00146DB24B|nr:hypothetical protein [Siminovitchia fordii]
MAKAALPFKDDLFFWNIDVFLLCVPLRAGYFLFLVWLGYPLPFCCYLMYCIA